MGVRSFPDGALLFISTERLDPFRTASDTITVKLFMVGAEKGQQPAAQPHDADTGLAVVSVNPSAQLGFLATDLFRL